MLDILITNVRYTNYKCNTINAKIFVYLDGLMRNHLTL